MLKRKRDPVPTDKQRRNPRRMGLLKGKQVSVYWAPSDIWAPAIVDKRVRTGIIIKWLSDNFDSGRLCRRRDKETTRTSDEREREQDNTKYINTYIWIYIYMCI